MTNWYCFVWCLLVNFILKQWVICVNPFALMGSVIVMKSTLPYRVYFFEKEGWEINTFSGRRKKLKEKGFEVCFFKEALLGAKVKLRGSGYGYKGQNRCPVH